MAYRNFILRSFFSIIFLVIYIFICIFKFEYTFYLISLIYIFIFFEIFLFFKKNKLIIYMYLLISFISIFNIKFTNENIYAFNIMIISIISFDIFSYIIGINFGKKKIFKMISPNKTYEGLVGGFFSSIIISLSFSLFFNMNINQYLFYFIIFNITLAFFGDIIESKFKRINNLKNSSNFIPGHGGFFDRFDSFVLTIIPFSLINEFILWRLIFLEVLE